MASTKNAELTHPFVRRLVVEIFCVSRHTTTRERVVAVHVVAVQALGLGGLIEGVKPY